MRALLLDAIRRISAALTYRDFRLLWMGALTSSIGTWMQKVAQAWLIVTLTEEQSAFYLGLDSFLGELPILLLTIVGGVVDPDQAPPIRASQPSAWARRPGLMVCGALASRGITSSSLAGELAAALALGLPAPVERSLIDAVDPARYVARAWRHRQPEVSKP